MKLSLAFTAGNVKLSNCSVVMGQALEGGDHLKGFDKGHDRPPFRDSSKSRMVSSMNSIAFFPLTLRSVAPTQGVPVRTK